MPVLLLLIVPSIVVLTARLSGVRRVLLPRIGGLSAGGLAASAQVLYVISEWQAHYGLDKIVLAGATIVMVAGLTAGLHWVLWALILRDRAATRA